MRGARDQKGGQCAIVLAGQPKRAFPGWEALDCWLICSCSNLFTVLTKTGAWGNRRGNTTKKKLEAAVPVPSPRHPWESPDSHRGHARHGRTERREGRGAGRAEGEDEGGELQHESKRHEASRHR